MGLNKENYPYSDPKKVPNLIVDETLKVAGVNTSGGGGGGSGSSVGGGAVAQTAEPGAPVAGLVWVDTDGIGPGSQLRRWRKSLTSGLNSVTGPDDNGNTLAYTVNYEQVYINGVLLTRNLDYTAVTGATINLSQATAAGDVIEVFSSLTTGIVNAYTSTQSDARYLQVSTGGNVGIGTAVPAAKLHVVGDMIASSIGTNTTNDSLELFTGTTFNTNGDAAISIRPTATGYNNGGMEFYAGGSERMRINSAGLVGIGNSNPDTKLDIWGPTVGNALGSVGRVSRMYSAHTDGSGITNQSLLEFNNVRETAGNFWEGAGFRIQHKVDATFQGYIQFNGGKGNTNSYGISFGTGGDSSSQTNIPERMRIDSSGNVGIKLNNQSSIAPSGEMTLEVNTNGAQGAAWFKNFSGSRSAPNEVADWPWPVAAITTAGNFYLATMLRFSLPNDNLWQTDDSTWNFKLNGVTASGWDANTNLAIKTTSDADLGLQLLGPGNLRLGTQNARSVLFRTNGQDQARVDSNGYMLLGYTTSNGAFRLQVNSQIFATSSSIATSDGRYKENVEELTGGVDMIKALRPVEFNWKKQEDVVVDERVVREAHSFPEGKTVGFIAQEVQEALSDKPWISNLIKENVREAVKDNQGNELAAEEEFLGIAETNLIAVLVSAVKELTARVEELEAKK